MTNTAALSKRVQVIEAQRNPPAPPVIRVCWGRCDPGTCSICDPENSPPELVILWEGDEDD